MTDVQLRTLIRAQLLAILPLYGFTGIPVIGANQPTSEGRVTGPAIYFYPLDDQREGWQQKSYAKVGDLATQSDKQILASSFQISVVAPETEDLSLPQASDICRAASIAVQSSQFIDALQLAEAGAGVRRVSTIRSPYIVNDRGQFEKTPTFDVTITHAVKYTTTAPEVDRVTALIHRT